MRIRSRHYGDIIEWIGKVIDSCETHQQTFAASKLIRNFEDQLTTEYESRLYYIKYHSLVNSLRNKLSNKRQELLNKGKL